MSKVVPEETIKEDTLAGNSPFDAGLVFNDVIKPAKPIPIFIWLMLHLVRTYYSVDREEYTEEYTESAIQQITEVTYAKKLFGHMYIWKTEYYINDTLVNVSRLTRKGV